MNKNYTATGIATRIWIISSCLLGLGCLIGSFFVGSGFDWWIFFPVTVAGAIGSLPALVILMITLASIEKMQISRNQKITILTLVCFGCSAVYGMLGAALGNFFTDGFLYIWAVVTGALFVFTSVSLVMIRQQLIAYFSDLQPRFSSHQNKYMETAQNPGLPGEPYGQVSKSNKIIIKAAITGALILLMMIPTVFITNLVNERQDRQQEVATEVSNKWAKAQTLSGPYLFIHYKTYYKDNQGKKISQSDGHLWILPDNLNLTGTIVHELRPRSIYKVLLYRAGLQTKGNFILHLPKEIDPNDVEWADSKICYGISDFKGIEERLAIKFNAVDYELSPGLPANDIDSFGLSAPVSLSIVDIGKSISFDSKLKLKGSGQLHFLPLSGNSSYSITSTWPDPSFDGNSLPTERNVTATGFDAKWTFNKDNLPFGTILKDFKFDQNSIAFGVTMLEPADQYAKTSRCIKYAILFIGLTFSLFFIVEIMQNKPVHPVQYVLIGIALVIFYTLLLSISEFILFDYAYLLASMGTILLISLYARGHFNSWKSAGIFGGVLTILYGFIFILIRLEDTALLVGSIGLFIVLALVMYTSRKINWYGTPVPIPA
jgi:inner membrane protein